MSKEVFKEKTAILLFNLTPHIKSELLKKQKIGFKNFTCDIDYYYWLTLQQQVWHSFVI